MGTMTWAQWVIGALGPLSALMAGRKWVSAWIVLAAQHVLFLVYALVTGQIGFLPMNITMFTIATYNTWKWAHERLAPEPVAVGRHHRG